MRDIIPNCLVNLCRSLAQAGSVSFLPGNFLTSEPRKHGEDKGGDPE